MAKTAKLKKHSKSTSRHSRLAKRATSPSLNLDKSITSLPAPSSPPHRSKTRNDVSTISQGRKNEDSILAPQRGAGVSKRRTKGKAMSRAQRMRVEKGMERAEAVGAKMEVKVMRKGERERVGRERGAAWDELNSKIQAADATRKIRAEDILAYNKTNTGATVEKEAMEDVWDDVDEEVIDEDGDASAGNEVELFFDAAGRAALENASIAHRVAETLAKNGDGRVVGRMDEVVEDEVL